jgi:hypothetical protein
MQNITSAAKLRTAIQLLEVEQAINGQLLKEQFFITYESLKPINLLKRTLSYVVSSPFLIDNILGTAVGLASGYLSKKIVVGGSVSIVRKLLGSFLQLGVTNFVAKHPEAIKSVGQLIFHRIFDKKKASLPEQTE